MRNIEEKLNDPNTLNEMKEVLEELENVKKKLYVYLQNREMFVKYRKNDWITDYIEIEPLPLKVKYTDNGMKITVNQLPIGKYKKIKAEGAETEYKRWYYCIYNVVKNYMEDTKITYEDGCVWFKLYNRINIDPDNKFYKPILDAIKQCELFNKFNFKNLKSIPFGCEACVNKEEQKLEIYILNKNLL